MKPSAFTRKKATGIVWYRRTEASDVTGYDEKQSKNSGVYFDSGKSLMEEFIS